MAPFYRVSILGILERDQHQTTPQTLKTSSGAEVNNRRRYGCWVHDTLQNWSGMPWCW